MSRKFLALSGAVLAAMVVGGGVFAQGAAPRSVIVVFADDAQLGPWLEEYPGTDAQQLRALIRQARKDFRDSRPGESQRQGRAYRQLFALVREQISSSAGTPS